MMPSRAARSLIALVAAACSNASQPDGARVRLSADTFHIARSVDGRPAPPDTLFQSLLSVSFEGQPALLQVYHQGDFTGGVVLDSLWMHPRTLEPIRHSRRSSQLVAHVSFSSGRITGRVSRPNGATQIVDTLFRGRIYDAGASDLVARALPLIDDRTVHLTLYVPGYGANPMRIAWSGRDTIRTRKGILRAAWRLTGSIGGEPLTMWVAIDNRDLLELVAGDSAAPSVKYTRQ